MNRSGSRPWRALLPGALAVFLLFATLKPMHARAQAGGLDREVAMHYSLYFENFKHGNYMDALPNLHWILEHNPGFPRSKDTNFDRATTIYESLAEDATDPELKRVYLDSALAMFDRAVPVIKSVGGEIDEFRWTRDKGRFIQEHLDVLDDMKEEAVAAYRAAYALDPMRINPYYLDVIINDKYAAGDIGGALDFLRELKASRGDEDGIDNIIRKYFTVIPPDEQIGFLEEQFEVDPDNTEVIQQLFGLYQQEGYYGKLLELAPLVLALDPTPDVLRMLTRMYLEDGDTDQAIAIFTQLSELSGVEMKAQDFHNMGIAQQELGNFAEARRYYRQAVDADPEYSDALLAIAHLYATAVARCGVADREQAAVFWLIADAYQRAGDSAGVSTMRGAFPTAEDVFYVQRWSNGQSTEVSYSCRGLTISGTTVVRQR